jgi:hypothetical protein
MIRFLLAIGLFAFTYPISQKPQPAEPGQTQRLGGATRLDKKNAEGATPADPGVAPDDQVVKVIIATSRPEVSTSGNFGVHADLQNAASVPITIYPKNIRLVAQPEITNGRDCIYSQDGFFPTEPNPDKDHPLGGPIVIQPGEHYQIFWAPGSANCEDASSGSRWVTFGRFGVGLQQYALRTIGFLPGDYAFVIVGKVSLSPDGVEQSPYHTFVQVTKLHVGITQLQAIVAAMIGGLLAYFVAALRENGELRTLKIEQVEKKRSSLWKWGVILRSLCSAALLSSVITVILSRISDTQFPVKVSVNDFWGALTVGFFAYFTGNNLINRIVGLASNPAGGAGNPTPPITPAPPLPLAAQQPVAPPPPAK